MTSISPCCTDLPRLERARHGPRPSARPLASAVLALAALLALAAPGRAQTEVPENWALIPSGLELGDSFRLLFATQGTRDATATGIGQYNQFVQTAAAGGHADIRDYSSEFNVVASTAGTDARANTETTYTNDDKGVPIYWLGGSKVADDYEGFYDGDWDDEANPKDQNGDARPLDQSSERPFTGSTSDGTAASGNALGNITVRVGEPNDRGSGSFPLDGNTNRSRADSRPLYALSPVFVVVNVSVSRYWSLLPAGLGIGDSFRLLFATSNTRDADDTDIAFYNTFVQNAAAAGHADIQAYSSIFRVVGSTADTDARDNTRTTYTDDDKGVLIYWLDGAKVADDYEDFYDGGWDEEANAKNEFGNARNIGFDQPFTGSKHDGTAALLGSTTFSSALGTTASTSLVTVGRPNSANSNHGPIGSNAAIAKTALRPFYALSGVFEVINYPPVFVEDDLLALRRLFENTAAGENVGGPVAATDPDSGDTLTYSLGGADAESFDFVTTSGQIQTKAGVTYDYETKPVYSVTVSVSDGHATVTVTVLIELRNLAEPPAAPAAPAVRATAGTTDSLSVSWQAPVNPLPTGITDYDVQYSVNLSGSWINVPHGGTGLSADISGLAASTAYEVQVRASNTDGTGDWSGSGKAFTGSPPTEVPGDWPLIPAGLAAGESFRLLFIPSSGRTARSSQIFSYNSSVQTAAAGGHADIQAYSHTFRMLGSTEAVDARDNTATTGPGVPIYWLGGAKVADDYADFYDGEWHEEATGRRANGDAVTLTSSWKLWTGSDHDGTELLAPDTSSRALGNAGGNWVGVGTPNSTTDGRGPLSGTTDNRNESKAVYALSGVFTVALEATVPGNWALIPEGLSAGDKFRLLFATSTTRNAASLAIADYNSFVQARAAAGHSAIQGYSAGFRVVASTAAVDARDNTETTYTNSDRGPPIYWLGGAKVADDYGDFYDGDWADEAGSKDESGDDRLFSDTTEFPFTGSNNNGTGDRSIGSTCCTLGSTSVRAGAPNVPSAGNNPLSGAGGKSSSDSRPFYALSPVFTVGEGVGVPADWSLKPADLTSGDSFRLLFVTHTGRRPASTDIEDYNTYVQSQANAGSALAAIKPYSSGFRVVGSTAAVDARDNTETRYTATNKGVPIYWLNGSKVADDYQDFYDQTWDDEANPRQRNGTTVSPGYVWTGSTHDGVEAHGNTFNPLGFGSSSVRLGRLNDGSAGPLSSLLVAASTQSNARYYALSALFTVETPVAAGTNRAPVFADIAPAARSVAENSDAGENVGLPVAATDGNGDSLTYSLGGTDAASFEIVSTSGQIRTKAGVTYDYETKSSYSVVVSVTDNTYTDSIAVTITLTDVLERPAKPDAPVVSASPGTTDTLSVSWTAPEDFGKQITDYDLRYRAGGSAAWIDLQHDGTGLSATITGLSAGTAYEVQVRATNEDGTGAWSDSGRAATGIPLEVSQDWGLLPAGLTAGDRFRLLFATSTTRDGTDSDIAVYNSFVQTAAAAGHADIRTYSSGFTVVASTAAVDARNNTRTTYTNSDKGVPIYWLDGAKVADHYADFYDADWDDESGSKDESGDDRLFSDTTEFPFTGSNNNGTGDRSIGSTCCTLGSTSVRAGAPNVPSAGNNPLSGAGGKSSSDSRPFYALSPVFVVGPGITVPANWALIPDGLEAGDRFRLLFATSTSATATENRDASSTDIADYNSFVQGRAAAGHAAIQAYSAGFRVVASTAAVHARDNTASRFDAMSADKGPPIYWLGGNQVADDYQDFYDGSWDDEANSTDESGNARSLSGTSEYPFTGSDGDGTKHYLNYVLGGSRVSVGRPNSSADNTEPLTSISSRSNTVVHPFYALSPVFVVGSETRVPSNWGLIPTGLGTGDRFRLLFVSSATTNASSDDIATYNTHVQDLAAAGLVDIRNYSDSFRMVGSTDAVSARDNTAMSGTGVPIYWLNGAKLADDYEDFYDGDWDEEASGRRETGAAFSIGSTWEIWTGSAQDGTKSINRTLGNANNSWVRVGRPNSSDSSHGPIAGNTRARTSSRGVYALSGVFAVGTQAYVSSMPVFIDTGPAERSVEENPAEGTDVGAAVAATDENTDDRLTYSLGGTDAASFEIDSASGQIQTKAGVTYDHEAKSSYSVTVSVTDGRSTVTITVTITVTDVAEPPHAPDAPGVFAPAGTGDTLDVSWTAPDNAGRPDITDYDVQYSVDGSGTWIDFDHTGTALVATITGLDARTAYEVQVRATNADGTGDWSDSGRATTPMPTTVVPANWALVPDGLAAGDTFRLLFATSTSATSTENRDATSTDIADYNSFVQGRAAAGHVAIQAYSSGFRVVGSTAAVDARDNTASTFDAMSDDKGPPIHWLGGTKVADDYQDFYDGDWDDEANSTDESGDARPLSDREDWPFTGSNANGTKRGTVGVSWALGAFYVSVGKPNDPANGALALSGGVNENNAFTRPFYALSAVFMVGSDTSVASNWGLVPDGLTTGDRFRLLFLSSTTRDAGSSDIADYNSFVQTAAAAGHADLQYYSDTFRMVGSTETVDARDNTATNYTNGPRGVPIYWLNGAKLADDYPDFYDGSWDEEGAGRSETGAEVTLTDSSQIWTGSADDGTAFVNDNNDSRALGNAGGHWVRVGRPTHGSYGPIEGTIARRSETKGVYALSGVFAVGAHVLRPPVFTDTGPAARSVPENTGAGENVGAAVAATDENTDETLNYSLGGTDAASFEIDSASGQIRTKAGVTYDHEAQSSYSVEVSVTDGRETVTISVTITVTDVEEPPDAPDAPGVFAPAGAGDTLEVSWTAPDNTGPDIDDYDVQYSVDGSGTWTNFDHTGTEVSATITGLDARTAYEVQVRATNEEGTGGWSDSGRATTPMPTTAVPANWPLIPDGLAAGDTFRLLFGTSTTRDATATGIADYNSFVQTAAAAGHAAIQAYSAGFRVVGSTAATDARDNTASTFDAMSDDKGPPIYWLGANKVADDYQDFYDGSWDDEANPTDESGDARSLSGINNNPYTGSNHDGTAHSTRPLGAGQVRVARLMSADSGSGPLSSTTIFFNTFTLPFYALSEVFAVGSEVPVPLDWALKPDGLNAGDRFRLLFLTYSGRSPTSSAIADYNSYVQSQAAADNAHEAIKAYSSGFRVVGSTADDDARDNTGTTYTNSDKGVPIHWLNGNQVADDYEDFYDQSWDDETNPTGRNGNAVTSNTTYVWTGSTHTGTESFATGFGSAAFGKGNVRLGRPNHNSSGPLWSTALGARTNNNRRYYALSPVFEVAAASNSAPAFTDTGPAARSVAENSDAGEDVGTPLGATDEDYSDALQYSLGGTDAASFAIVTSSGQIQTKAALDHETQASYTVDVSVTDGTATATIAVTITVTDVEEPPDAPGAPGVFAPAGTTDTLSVSWTAPETTGRPDIDDYDVQYSVDGSGTWMESAHAGTGLSATITGLSAGTVYEVQVRAGNDEGASAWSAAGRAATGSPPTEVPSDWGLIPSGLTTGDSFRLLFIPATAIHASSPDIHVYNTWVQARAAAGHADIQAYSHTFRMVGSTDAVDARDNTATTGTGVPIYWLGGAKVADHYADFYDGDWDEEASGRRETGAAVSLTSSREIWTGSDHDGTELLAADDSSRALGNADDKYVGVGRPNHGTHGPLKGNTKDRIQNKAVYALSGVFTVGAVTVPANWALKPDGLGPGDSFRLLFATSTTRGASSSDIADYNTFVQTAAAAGHADIQAHSAFFRVVGGTSATDARDNTLTTYTSDDQGLPIYWLGGNKVADHYADFYDGDWDDEANATDESGSARTISSGQDRPYTGSGHDGTEPFSGGDSFALGQSGNGVVIARPNDAFDGAGPLSSGSFEGAVSTVRPFYALSPVFVVGSGVTVPSNWSLNPTGLSTGDAFRLLFATSTTRNATDTDIADYNTFVQTRAAAGHAAIQDYSSGFRAVGSTADTDARDNTASTFDAMSDDKGPPIYWLGGNKVADNYEDFYDGDWDDEANAKDESGDARDLSGNDSPWTGSKNDGTEAFSSTNASRALGSQFVTVGKPNSSTSGEHPLSSGTADIKSSPGPFYALSAVFRVGSQVVATIDPAATAILLSVSPASVAEDAGATTVTVTATLNGAALATATEVTVSDGGGGTATSGTDYTAVSQFTLTIQANQASGTGTFEFTPSSDGTAEGNETVRLRGTTTDLGSATADLTITDPAATGFALTLDAIAGDDVVNVAEKAAGFAITGDTGTVSGVSVSVTVGSQSPLTATTDAQGKWTVSVPANAAYITGTSVSVSVSASKAGFASPDAVTRSLGVDLVLPTAPTYMAPGSLAVGEAITALSPSGGSDIATYGATDLPPGLVIDGTSGAISGTPSTADENTATATVTVKDAAGNPATVDIVFPKVAQGEQELTGFAYDPATVTVGGTAPSLTAPMGAEGALSYTATPSTVCTVDATTGALTIVAAGSCAVTARAASTANYKEATAEFTVTVQNTLALTLDAIAGDDVVNVAEKAAGFAITGDTGTVSGVSVSVTVGSQSPLTATTDAQGKWTVSVPANAAYITGTSVSVSVSASKAGFMTPDAVTRSLGVDLVLPTAPTYMAPGSLAVGEAITALSPSGGSDIATYGAADLPPGLVIDGTSGAISGTPSTADENTATATVTVKDAAGNPATVDIVFPKVAQGEQELTGFAYDPATVTVGGTAPSLTAPMGAEGALSYTATPSTVCTVDATTGALTIVAAGSCAVTARAASTANYKEATAEFTVTVQNTLALTLDAIAGDDVVNVAEKAAGFAITGDTGTVSGVSVSVTVGSQSPLTATTDAQGKWTVSVAANAAYITGTSVSVSVSASKAGFASPDAVTRSLGVDLVLPTAPTYMAPGSLAVGEAITALSPSGGSDIATYGAADLPPGLVIDGTSGAISGTPSTADENTATATVTVKDAAGNPATVDIVFPKVAQGEQELTGFAYDPATVTVGGTAPSLRAPMGAEGALSYTATPSTVCTVDATTGALTIVAAGSCAVTARAASTANYKEATAEFTVTVQNTLALTLDAIAGDDVVNVAEKAAGFAITGDTGTVSGVSVSVTVGSQSPLTATTDAQGKWTVSVPANAAYITGTSVSVSVSASKAGFTTPDAVTRSLGVDLVLPTAPTYTAPGSLTVGEAITALSPSGGSDIDTYGATDLPPGLAIDSGSGAISGTPSTADENTATATVTVKDAAGNPATVDIVFPKVAQGEQELTGFAYDPATVTVGGTAPSLRAPMGAEGALSYTATPSTVCTVDATTGELTIVAAGSCAVTARAASTANYKEATAEFTVTVQNTLALTLDAIAGDGVVNVAEKAAGFAITGDTGAESGVSVSVTIGSQSPLTATTDAQGEWTVSVAANAAYITGTSVSVSVSASKTGFTSPEAVTRSLGVDLVLPTAPSYTPPGSLTVGEALTALSPSGGSDIDTYGAADLPAGLVIDGTSGEISGTPSTADENTATATVTVKDAAGNPATVDIEFPMVAKGAQDLAGFEYDPATVTVGGTAPTLTAPPNALGALSYTATPMTVCTVNATTGALTLVAAGSCKVTARAASTVNYKETTAEFTVTVQNTLGLTLDAIAGDDVVNVAEKAAGFAITGDTGAESGVSVSVTIGSQSPLTATTDAQGGWTVSVAANAAYITGTSVSVSVSASKAGFTAPEAVTRSLGVDLVLPTAPSYTPPASLTVGEALTALSPSGGSDIDTYGAADLPAGLVIDGTSGEISGTPSTADENTATATVTVKDAAGNPATVDIEFPMVAKGAQDLAGFAYDPATVTVGGTAPSLRAPMGAEGALSYTATPMTVCTVDATTGALTIVAAGSCKVTARAASTANYKEATAEFTVTVRNTLGLTLDAIAGDDVVNVAEKAAGFAITGDTGAESGVSVSVTIGSQSPLTATTDAQGEWTVSVAANAAYITGTSVSVSVSASKTGFTSPEAVTRSLGVDLVLPTAPSYTPPGSLTVGEALTALSPSGGSDIDTYGAADLPAGLVIDGTSGEISGTPSTADENTATATVTVKDAAGNPATVDIEFPMVAKGAQDLAGFEYDPATVTVGGTAPTLTAPPAALGALSYTATPMTVCTVNATTGALTLVAAGSCKVTARAAATTNYKETTAEFTVTVQNTLGLTLDAIAGDDVVNVAEKAAGFAITGDTGAESGVSVSVTIGSQSPLTATTDAQGKWTVSVPANAAYITGTSVSVSVSASKAGFTTPDAVTRSLGVDLEVPTAPTYTAPGSLAVGEAITALSPSGGSDIATYSATNLPPGLVIDGTSGAISGTPSTADENTATATVTVKDAAGNPATVDIVFPKVAQGEQELTGFAYDPATVTVGGTAPSLRAPMGAEGALSYTATPATVCTVNATTGALTIVAAGSCAVTARAASTANYKEATAEFTVTVQDTASTAIELSVDPASVAENDAATTVTVTAALDAAARTTATTVTVSRTGGTGTSGTDYTAISNFTLTIAATETSGTGTFTFMPTNDSVAESSETVVLTASAPGLTAGTATLTITDDDTSTAIALSVSPDSVAEGGGARSIAVTVALDGAARATGTPVTVSWTATGTATAGTDYAAVSGFTLTIPANQTSRTRTLAFTPTDDNVAEGDETVVLSASASGTGLADGSATLTIRDDETASTAIALSARPARVSENGGARTVTLTARLDAGTRETATEVTVSRTGGDATSGTDYAAVSSLALTIPERQASGTASFTFTPLDDSDEEGDETVVLSASASGLTAGTATLTISDDESVPTAITLSLDPDSVAEDAGSATVTVTAALNRGIREAATPVRVTLQPDSAAAGDDYRAVSPFTVTIPAGDSSASGTFTLRPEDDAIAEGTERLEVVGTATGLAEGRAALRIRDDDEESEAVILSVSPSSVSESTSSRSVRVTATLDEDPRTVATNVVVTLSSQEAAFGPGQDAAVVEPFTITIQPGRTSASRSFTFRPRDDDEAEGTESIQVTGEATGLRVEPATLELTDNDTATVNLAVPYLSRHSEGGGEAYVVVEATLDTERSADTTVTVQVRGSRRSGVVGFEAVADFELTIPAGKRRGEAGFDLQPQDDSEAERDETLTISGRASGLRVTSATFLLEDDDSETASTKVTLELSETRLAESEGTHFDLTVTGTLDGAALEQDTVVTLEATNRESDGSEVTARVDSGIRLTIRKGRISGQRTFGIVLNTLGIDQANGRLTLGGTADELAVEAATLELLDGDAAPDLITLTLSETRVPEGWSGRVNVLAEMTPSARGQETVVELTVTGSGRAGAVGFEAVADFKLTIPKEWEAYGTGFDLFTEDDDQAGRDETLTVRGTTDVAGLRVEPATMVLVERDGARNGPAKVTLWTDRAGYEAGQPLRLYREVDPGSEGGEREQVYYRERIGSGERVYLVPREGPGLLREAGPGMQDAAAGPVEAAERGLAWEGPAPEPGLWQFVAELREPGSGQLLRRAYAKFVVSGKPPVVLGADGAPTRIAGETRWTSDTIYKLRNTVVVQPGATLKIEAGTLVQGLGSRAAILVLRGGRIEADGTREAPVALTCDAPLGQRQPGCWGGLALLGGAPVRGAGRVPSSLLPGAQAAYGGTDAGDSSGSLRHVRVEFAGAAPTPGSPRAAVALYGAGSGTRLERVQAHASLGDGFLFRGGTAGCSHCVASGSRDGGVDWSEGWRGTLRHLYVQQAATGGHGLEGRGDGGPPAVPSLYNATLVGGGRDGIRLEGGATFRGRDVLVTGFAGTALQAQGNAASWLAAGGSSLDRAILHANGDGGRQVPVGLEAHVEYEVADPWLLDIRDGANPDPRPHSGSPALRRAGEAAGNAAYIGAFGGENWLEEWTVFGPEPDDDTRGTAAGGDQH